MVISGYAKMSVSMNVIGMETDAVEVNRFGKLVITDPEQFFADWVDQWNSGNGELMGASEIDVDLETAEYV